MDTMSIRYKFKEAFEKSGLSLREIGRRAGITHPMLLRLRDAKSPHDKGGNISLAALDKLAEALEVKHSDLITFMTGRSRMLRL